MSEAEKIILERLAQLEETTLERFAHLEALILDRFNQVEKLIRDNAKKVLTFEEFCAYAGFSGSHGYKLTSANEIAFYRPHGKLIYFERSDVEKWLLRNRVKSRSEINDETDNSSHA